MFVLSHDKTLEELDFSHTNLDDNERITETNFVPFYCKIELSVNSFPRLKRLRCNVSTLHCMDRVNMSSLRTHLEKLSITYGGTDDDVDLHSLSTFSLKRWQDSAFPAVRELCLTIGGHMDLSQDDTRDLLMTIELLASMVKNCQASLEVLKLRTAFVLDAGDLAYNALVTAKKLERIHLSPEAIEGKDEERYAKVLARYCKNLREVWMAFEYGDGEGRETGSWVRIERGSVGGKDQEQQEEIDIIVEDTMTMTIS
jgi:hypothetical protein